MRRQLSAPVSLMVIVVGAALSYYVLHANGWNWNGNIPLAYVYRGLRMQSRVLVIVGLMINAWGLGNLLNALLAKKPREQFPPSA
ncbi:MAG: hypothetical protein ACXV5R_00900 [Candidatus Angelobacter sp.]